MGNEKENPHQHHRQRILTRYRENGFSSFEEHNILEVLLFQSIPRADTNPTAHALISRFGSLYNVLTAPTEQLLEVAGIGPASAHMLKMVFAAGQEARLRKIAEKPFTDPETRMQYAVEWFAGKPEGTVAILLLDAFRLLHVSVLSEKHTVYPLSYPDAILAEAEKYHAPQIILMHNHADGCMHASADDLFLTDLLYKALKERQITLEDHLIVHDFDCISILKEAVPDADTSVS